MLSICCEAASSVVGSGVGSRGAGGGMWGPGESAASSLHRGSKGIWATGASTCTPPAASQLPADFSFCAGW